jgi:hypothetical protein
MPYKRKSGFQIGTSLQSKLMVPVFLAVMLPTTVVIACFYILLYAVLASPAAVAGDSMPLTLTISKLIWVSISAVPLAVLAIWCLAAEVTGRMVGPLNRITEEIEECLAGTRQPPLRIRPGDYLQDLVDQINRALEKRA